ELLAGPGTRSAGTLPSSDGGGPDGQEGTESPPPAPRGAEEHHRAEQGRRRRGPGPLRAGPGPRRQARDRPVRCRRRADPDEEVAVGYTSTTAAIAAFMNRSAHDASSPPAVR